MSDAADLVREFHEIFHLPINDSNRTTDALRARLIREEAEEAAEAIEARGMSSPHGPTVEEMAAIAQELADLVYVAYGAALTYGIDLDRAVAAVHRSNLTKTTADATGKVRKGDHYLPPDMTAALRDYLTERKKELES